MSVCKSVRPSVRRGTKFAKGLSLLGSNVYLVAALVCCSCTAGAEFWVRPPSRGCRSANKDSGAGSCFIFIGENSVYFIWDLTPFTTSCVTASVTPARWFGLSLPHSLTSISLCLWPRKRILMIYFFVLSCVDTGCSGKIAFFHYQLQPIPRLHISLQGIFKALN